MTLVSSWTMRWLPGLGLAAVLGCAARPASTPARSGTARMADTLARLYTQALGDAMRYPFLNRRRADLLQTVLANQSGHGAPRDRYFLAQELLRAGQTREAISEIQRLMQAVGVSRDRITRDNKVLFDLFGIAWLRLGEQENCLDNPGAEVCILPLTGTGRHGRQEGAREAIAIYEELLRKFPDDRGSQWLLNIAYMALGGYPDRIPGKWLIPGLDPSRAAGGSFPRFPNIAGELGVASRGLAGGLVVEDFDHNGLLDLFVTSWGLNDPVRLFLADGKGGYVDKTRGAGLDGIVGGLNAVAADYDNDGYQDILVLRGAWLHEAGAMPNSLLRNRGDGSFEDVTFKSGLLSFHPTQTAAWADFNLDGCIDLFIGNESDMAAPDAARLGAKSHRSELFLNNCNGTFTEVSHRVGIDLDEFVKGSCWGDVNDDGLPDLYVSVMGGPNRLYVNRGGPSRDQWRFEERGAQAGVEGPVFSFPCWFWDYDQDSHEDLLVLSYDLRHVNEAHEAAAREYLGLPVEIEHQGTRVPVEHPRLYRNRGDGTFEDVTRQVGLDKVVWAMGSNFGDLDNDGWLDFYVGTGTPDLRAVVPNRMFRNVEGRRFEEVTLQGGFGHIQKGHSTAFADLDRDGDEDIYMVVGGAYEGDWFPNALFENPGWPGRNWVTLELAGRSANRAAIGARVEVEAVEPGGTTRTLYRTVGTGGSFGAGPLQLHIGLGPATGIRQVRIRWPDAARTTTTHTGLQVNRYYRIIQGEQPVPLDRPPVPFRKLAVIESDHHHADQR
jgi:hypothetical protein